MWTLRIVFERQTLVEKPELKRRNIFKTHDPAKHVFHVSSGLTVSTDSKEQHREQHPFFIGSW